MAHTGSPVDVVEVRDLRGRSYRVGERPQDLIGCSRAWMLAFAWIAMAGIGVLQYGYGVALTALHVTSGRSLAGALLGARAVGGLPGRRRGAHRRAAATASH